ncbi:c-type cytochrome [Sediminicoccus rosea]|jgi:cytochrome c553|uniref:C-type cytochrome n=1 Tax=Sediminicoccus rosea TaxID=1225128 RepID=A0ABZ0PKQ0_9PROT|nr:c-type cytochrome [Sediminicoccus rosea]WPB85690.1 c-type cytochrome [Sediminicoccus rosea]
MSLRLTLAAALLAAATSGSALAQDARRGAELVAPCAQCHGANGRSQLPDIPSLAGQPADFITIQMILLREGLRNVPAMQPFAAGKSDQDIQDIAAYFATLPPGPPDDRRPLDRALFAAGQALSGPRHCATCHVSDYGGRAQIPRVAAQREDYLLHALTQYRDGLRAGPDTQMNGAVQGLSDADLIALAHYLSHRD